MSEEDVNESNGSFGASLMSSSIYFEDPNATEELSKIIMSGLPQNEQQQSICDLKEKNEFKSAYKNKEKISDQAIQESFNDNKIKPSDQQFQSNLNGEMYSKLKSNEIKEEDNLYLKIEDFPENSIMESFIYSEARDKINCLVPIYEKELNSIGINGFKRENIYKGKGVETMVEETYGYDKYLKNQMTEEICYLKRIMNSWRRVAGDGNCFYRSVIFSWLEYLIFNKKITILQIVMANIYTKFEPNYIKNKELPTYLKKQFITEERFVALTILEIIISQLTKNQIKEAYLTLIKAFNITRVFDRIMIFYLRYLLYEYISDNKDKLFKKDFPVLLGNLLPQEYEKEDGTFLYKEYFINDLLKFYTCAEKLAVYLVPFILKVNLNIVFYYFGNECDIENKFFSCELPNKDKKKDTLNVLYRKAHYDISYNKEFYNDFQPLLDIYSDLKMAYQIDYYVVDLNTIRQKEKELNESEPYNPQVSVIFNRKLFEKKKKEKEQQKQNEAKKEEKKEIYNSFDIIDIMENELNGDIIIDKITKSHSINKCFICEKDLKNNDIKENLPCKCNICFCSDKCKEKYYKSLALFFKNMEFGFNKKCGNCGNNISRTSFLENINLDNENVKNALKNKMLEFYKKYCMNCLVAITPEKQYKILKCKCPQLHKLLDTNKFEHRLCQECFNCNTGNCKICNLYHSRLVK